MCANGVGRCMRGDVGAYGLAAPALAQDDKTYPAADIFIRIASPMSAMALEGGQGRTWICAKGKLACSKRHRWNRQYSLC